MKPYSGYKPSGVSWLGNVPENWGVQRLRFRVKLNPSFSKPLSADLPVSFLPMEAVGDDGTLDLERTRLVGEVASGYTYFEDGDITIAKITPCYENGKGAVMEGLVGGVGFGTTELIVMRPIQADCPKWLYYVTKCNAFRFPGEAMMQGAGGQKRVPDLFVKDYFVSVPTYDEQQAIANYLDVETARINTLIHEKNDLIGLLGEWRQSVIAETVTKGLDKNVTTKPSGVQWLGEVPSHWEVVPIRYLSRGVKTGGTPAQEAFVDEQSEGVIPWYSPADLRDLFLTGCSRMVAAEYRSEVDVFAPGTIALVGIGDVGRVAMLTEEGTGNQQLNFIRPVAGIASIFLTYALMAAQEFVRSRANVTLIPILNQENTKRLRFAVPTPEEQRAITAYLDAETAKIDDLIAHTNDEITLLKELRAATIADAVLGRVDVRAAA